MSYQRPNRTKRVGPLPNYQLFTWSPWMCIYSYNNKLTMDNELFQWITKSAQQ